MTLNPRQFTKHSSSELITPYIQHTVAFALYDEIVKVLSNSTTKRSCAFNILGVIYDFIDFYFSSFNSSVVSNKFMLDIMSIVIDNFDLKKGVKNVD